MCPPAAIVSLIKATRSVNVNLCRSTSDHHQSFLKDCSRCNAPLAACVSVETICMCMCVCAFPRAFAVYPQFNSIYDLSLLPLAWNPATLLAPVLLPTLRAAPAAGTVALTLAVTPGATSPSPAAVHTSPISTQAIGWCHLPWPPVSG